MRPLRWLFAPDFAAPLTGALADARAAARALASLPAFAWRSRRKGTVRATGWAAAAGMALAAGGLGSVAVGIAGLVSAPPAAGQSLEAGLFREEDEPTRALLRFLSDFDAQTYAALGQMLSVFNGGLLILAGFLLVWHTVAGTVDTAREGRWGFGGWEIVRIVVAVALMAPLPGGMNGAQHMVVGLAHLGGDFAAAVWSPFSQEVLDDTGPVEPAPPPVGATVGRLLVAEVCRDAANWGQHIAGLDPYPAVIREERVSGGAKIRLYEGRWDGAPENVCGAVRFGGATADGARRAVAEGYEDSFRTLWREVEAYAVEIAKHIVPGQEAFTGILPDIEAFLVEKDMAARYREAVTGSLKSALEEERKETREIIAEDARTSNWLAAASFFNTIAYRIGRFEAAASDGPEVALPVAELMEWSPAAADAVQAVMRALENSEDYNPVVRSGSQALPVSDATGGSRRASGGLLKWIDLDNVIVADSGNPVADLARMGHRLINAAMGAVVALATVSAGVGFVEDMPFVGKGAKLFEGAWQVGDGFITTLLSLVMVGGVVLAYVLPALPFIRFLFGILGWVIAVVAAVLAVTVFAAAHVTRGDGDRLFTSATRQGLLFLPGLILRPPLMLFGLVLGYFVFVAAIDLLNGAFLPHLRDAAGADALGLMGYVAMLAIYTMVAYGLMNGSMRLIEVLPSTALEWIGGRADGDAGGEGSVGLAARGMGGVGGMTRVGRISRGRGAGAGAGSAGGGR